MHLLNQVAISWIAFDNLRTSMLDISSRSGPSIDSFLNVETLLKSHKNRHCILIERKLERKWLQHRAELRGCTAGPAFLGHETPALCRPYPPSPASVHYSNSMKAAPLARHRVIVQFWRIHYRVYAIIRPVRYRTVLWGQDSTWWYGTVSWRARIILHPLVDPFSIVQLEVIIRRSLIS